jgi:cytochrome P450
MSESPISYDIDVYSDEVLDDPYPHYRTLRELGPAVWLPRNQLWAISRHKDVREALRNHQVFSSAHGVAGNEATNDASRGNLLATDPPQHDLLRRVVGAPLSPKALNPLRERLEASAIALVDRLVGRGSFDAVTDFAQYLPVSIVSELVGLPEEGRHNMLRWAEATFNQLGGENARTVAARPITQEMREYTLTATPDKLRPGSWAAMLYEAGEQGVIPRTLCPVLMRDYLGPSLDTTIFAISNLILLFGQNPDQWDIVRDDPSLILNAINECVRLESPIQSFTRRLLADHHVDGAQIPKGGRALVMYASANRDERKWDQAERFDVRRKVGEHVGFGHGIHTCAGMHLARMEMQVLILALTKRVRSFEIGVPMRAKNNVLRGLEHLPVKVKRV